MPLQLGILALAECVCVMLAFYCGALIRFAGDLESAADSIGRLGPRAAFYAGFMLLAMLSVGLYRSRQQVAHSEIVLRLATALVIGGLANAIVYYSIPALATGRGTLALAVLLTFPGLLVTRVAFFSLVDADRFKRSVAILGRGTTAAALQRSFQTLTQKSFRLVGFIPASGEFPQQQCHPELRRTGSFLNLVRRNRIDEIVVALDDRRDCFPARELLDCRLEGIRITEPTTFLERETGKIDLDTVRTSWLIYGGGFRQGPFQKLSKRVFDILASSVLLIVTAPVLAVAILGVFIESRGRGAILYRQARVGLNGQLFEIFKLRSMRTDAEQDGRARWAAPRDPRVTRVGAIIRRLRIDELPQIFNILRGEMSFVGPRPERPEFVDELSVQVPFYRERHCVKPGLTGWAQLCYPYGASLSDARQKLQYDLYYVKNRTIMFDLLILLQTFEVVIWEKGRHAELSAAEDELKPDAGRETA